MSPQLRQAVEQLAAALASGSAEQIFAELNLQPRAPGTLGFIQAMQEQADAARAGAPAAEVRKRARARTSAPRCSLALHRAPPPIDRLTGGAAGGARCARGPRPLVHTRRAMVGTTRWTRAERRVAGVSSGASGARQRPTALPSFRRALSGPGARGCGLCAQRRAALPLREGAPSTEQGSGDRPARPRGAAHHRHRAPGTSSGLRRLGSCRRCR